MKAEESEHSLSSWRLSSDQSYDPVDLIESIRSGPNTLPEAPLPGHGSVYTDEDDRPACGVDTETYFCADHGHQHEKGATCNRWDCPRCWKSAVLDRATTIVARLMNYRDKYSHSDEKKLHRVIISPPQDEEFATTADALDRFYEVCADLLQAGGAIDGGVQLLHEYRHQDELGGDIEEMDDQKLALVADSDDSRGVWPETLPDWEDGHAPEWSETRQLLSHEPHFHCYVVADWFHLPTSELYEETGWFVQRLQPYEGSNVSCYGIDDLARSVMYALSHVSNIDGRKNYRYFGGVANESPTESQRQRASEVCRNHAPTILGLPERSVSCKEQLEENEDQQVHAHYGGSGGGSSSSEDDSDVEWCNAELFHIRSLPDYWDDDWPEARKEKLKQKYRDYAGEPPPVG